VSVAIDMMTQGKDLPELLEWIAKILRTHPNTRWSLQLRLHVKKE